MFSGGGVTAGGFLWNIGGNGGWGVLLFWAFLVAVAAIDFLCLEVLSVGDWGSSSESGSCEGFRDVWTLLGAGVSLLFATWGHFRARRTTVFGSASMVS